MPEDQDHGPNWIMPVGKHRGQRLCEIPVDYLQWFDAEALSALEDGWAEDRTKTKEMSSRVQGELASRGRIGTKAVSYWPYRLATILVDASAVFNTMSEKLEEAIEDEDRDEVQKALNLIADAVPPVCKDLTASSIGAAHSWASRTEDM